MTKKVFTSQKITLIVAGQEFRVQALVSPYGAKYVLEDEQIPEELRERLGEEAQVIYKNVPVRARLVRETTAAGVIYNVRFLNPSGVLVRLIERDIRETGLPSPWIRSLPRLSTENKSLPAPALVVLHNKADTFFLNVKNFTLGGLLLEYSGEELRDVALGHRFEFDLVTNAGEKIPELSGVVSHVTVEVTLEASGSRRYFFGVKFLPMPVLSENKYRNLIREHCLGLREVGGRGANA